MLKLSQCEDFCSVRLCKLWLGLGQLLKLFLLCLVSEDPGQLIDVITACCFMGQTKGVGEFHNVSVAVDNGISDYLQFSLSFTLIQYIHLSLQHGIMINSILLKNSMNHESVYSVAVRMFLECLLLFVTLWA